MSNSKAPSRILTLSIFLSMSQAAVISRNGVIIDVYRPEVTVSAVGPLGTIHLRWPEVRCLAEEKPIYKLLVERDHFKRAEETYDSNFTIEHTEKFPVLFFYEYFLHLSCVCGEHPELALWVRRFSTGPGELLPLASLRAVPRNTSVSVHWKIPSELRNFCQNEEFRVDMTVCGRISLSCDIKSFPLCSKLSEEFKIPESSRFRQVFDVRASISVGRCRSRELGTTFEPILPAGYGLSVAKVFKFGFIIAYGLYLGALITFVIVSRRRK